MTNCMCQMPCVIAYLSSSNIALFSTHGGELKPHAHALETTWRKTINWFRQQLDVKEVYRDDWLDPRPQHIPSTRV